MIQSSKAEIADEVRQGCAKRRPAAGSLRYWCRMTLAFPQTKKAIKVILSDPTHPHFVVLWRAVSDRA